MLYYCSEPKIERGRWCDFLCYVDRGRVRYYRRGTHARKNRFLEFRTEVKDILDAIISICEEKDEGTYRTEKDDILDTLEVILVAIDTQLMPSAVNSYFEVKNQGSSQNLVSARSSEVKLPTLSLPIFSGVTEEWLAFSDLFEAALSNNKNLTGAQKLQYLKGSLNRFTEDFVATQVQLKDNYLRLEAAQEAVSGTLLQLEDNGEEFETDFTDAESYREKYLEYYTHIDKKLGETVISEVPGTPRKFKLPKLELRKFGGDPKEFLSFWSQFQKIHDDGSILDEDKMQYLVASVEPKSKAERLILSFSATATNYPKAVDQLKERFGREDLLVQIYVRDLLTMVMKNVCR
ncbi:DUF1758 domain-containing protein [Trichonephila clavipes]|nr:DUF1758 domain-containing protein [Trichonephila clavipes]